MKFKPNRLDLIFKPDQSTTMRIKHILLFTLFASIVSAGEWQTLFDGSSLDGWKHAEESL